MIAYVLYGHLLKIAKGKKGKNKDVKIKNILSIWYFKSKTFPDVILMKHKSRLYAHGLMKQWGVT